MEAPKPRTQKTVEAIPKQKEVIRTNLVMSLVTLSLDIKNVIEQYDNILLEKSFNKVLEESKLTEKEKSLYQYESNYLGI